MTWIDWIIVGFTVLMALRGYTLGLVAGALSVAGFAGGALLGARMAPLLLEEGSRSPYAPLFALAGALLLGGVLSSGLQSLGLRLRSRLGQGLEVLDGLGGAALIACLALGLAWILGAVALQAPEARELRRPIQRSVILQRLNATLPPSGPLLNALARFDPLPEIRGPRPDVGPPDAGFARDPGVQAAARSTVRVLGTACGLGVQGSGWVAGGGVVVTNAHVVAGQDDTTVQVAGEGTRHDAQAIWFDVHNDLAILRAPGISGVPRLRLGGQEQPGASAAILGFPGNGGLTIAAGRLGGTQTLLAPDAYGRGPVSRRVTLLRGKVRSGNSGGPAVNARGAVVTTIFAAGAGVSGTGFGVPNSIVNGALARAAGPVGTGPCVR